MDSYCLPYSEGELFPIFLIPVGLVILMLFVLIIYKIHLLEFIIKTLGQINPFILYFSGIPIVFILIFNSVYFNPNSFSASGSDLITDPMLRAIYVTGVFSIVWPLLLVAGIFIDSLVIGIAIYYPIKGIICGNIQIQFTTLFPIQLTSFLFSPLILFSNAAFYYLLTAVLIKHFKHKYRSRHNSDLRQMNY